MIRVLRGGGGGGVGRAVGTGGGFVCSVAPVCIGYVSCDDMDWFAAHDRQHEFTR